MWSCRDEIILGVVAMSGFIFLVRRIIRGYRAGRVVAKSRGTQTTLAVKDNQWVVLEYPYIFDWKAFWYGFAGKL